jgi:hypothetical protein
LFWQSANGGVSIAEVTFQKEPASVGS